MASFLRAFFFALTFSAGNTAGIAPAGAAPKREVVFADESFTANGERLPAQLDRFLRRLETVMGWPTGSTTGKVFIDPKEAMGYVRTSKPALVFLPLKEFLQNHKAMGLEPIATVVPIDMHDLTEHFYWGIGLVSSTINAHVHMLPGLRLAVPDHQDLQWVNVLFDGTLAPSTHFKYVPVASEQAAIAEVEAKRADFAMVGMRSFARLKTRMGEGFTFKVVFSTPPMPPPPIVVTRWTKPADRKKLAANITKLCLDEAKNVCGPMNMIFVLPPEAEHYRNWAWKYDQYRLR